nr:YigZ family protein [Nocardioides ginsengisegetis]
MTIARDGGAEIEAKRSRFLATLARVEDEAAARAVVERLRKQHWDAGHHCSAFVLGPPGPGRVERSSDDGEPAGTAGAPMLEVLRGAGVGDVVAVVTRWFGGTLLGAGGLVRAYGDAVRAALEQTGTLRRELVRELALEVDHADAGRIEGELRSRDVAVLDTAWTDRVTLRLGVAPDGEERLHALVAELQPAAASPHPSGSRGSTGPDPGRTSLGSMFWMSAFLDLASKDFEHGVLFWAQVTGYRVSAPRGEREEFATLVPPDGDDFLRVQRLGEGPSRIHLDLHVDDPRAEAARAVALGATQVDDHGYVVMRSPGDLTFCFVRHRSSTRPRPATWPGGHRSLVDQVCLDLPASLADAETEFWHALTGWELSESPVSRGFRRLERPTGMPFRILLQRLDEPDGPVRAHLDLASDDRAAETARHQRLGATVVQRNDRWTVLTDPAGSAYCITDRDPETGVLA